MAQKEYRELHCRDIGTDCDFLVRAETAEEVLRVAGEHGCQAHNLCEITPEAKDRMNNLVKSVWCGGKFIDIEAPREEWREN